MSNEVYENLLCIGGYHDRNYARVFKGNVYYQAFEEPLPITRDESGFLKNRLNRRSSTYRRVQLRFGNNIKYVFLEENITEDELLDRLLETYASQ